VTPATLVETLRARAVTLRAVGGRLRVRPASAVTPDELELLRTRKAEVLRLLAGPPPAPIPDLDPITLAEHFHLPLPTRPTPAQATRALADAMLTGRLDPKLVTDLHEQVVAAVHQLRWEIAAGTMKRGPRLVGRKPLADWLSLDDVARLLREGTQ
jgi:TubC N-terminal docking domain